MTPDPKERANELLSEAWDMPEGEPRMRAVEEAVRLADISEDEETQVDARMDLVEAATRANHPEIALVAFTWLLARFDAESEYVSTYQIMWRYKWVADGLTDFASLSRERIEHALDDFERRTRQHGLALKPLYGMRCDAAWEFGDLDRAREFAQLYRDAPSGLNADCRACTLNTLAGYRLRERDLSGALRIAQPLFDRIHTCRTVPLTTHTAVLWPLFREGRYDEAAEHYAKSLSQARAEVNSHGVILRCADFEAITGNFERAIQGLERRAPIDTAARSELSREHWYESAALLFECIARKQPGTRTLRLPKTCVGYQASGEYDMRTLADTLRAEAERLVGLFDQRNGNGVQSERQARYFARADHAIDYPLPEPIEPDEPDIDEYEDDDLDDLDSLFDALDES